MDYDDREYVRDPHNPNNGPPPDDSPDYWSDEDDDDGDVESVDGWWEDD